ncbi:MAG TPA: response regulator [Bacteroidales bacterium]|nr:response regulator [Bacteroidales bacterium]HPT01001.1 response regulator [Bacteroidales bacterium]
MKALIVDDEQHGRLMIALMLTRLYPDAAYNLASGVQEARLMISQEKYDVLFMDIDMPETNGLSFLEMLRKEGIHTPVIIVTAYSKFEYTRKAIQLGVVDYILKPVVQDDFISAMERMQSFQTGIQEPHTRASEKSLSERITFRVLNGIMPVRKDELVYCAADSAYAVLYLKNGEQVRAFEALGDIEEKLPADTFCRCGRKYLVNLSMVRKLNLKRHSCLLQYDKGVYEIELSDSGFAVLKQYFSGPAEEDKAD